MIILIASAFVVAAQPGLTIVPPASAQPTAAKPASSKTVCRRDTATGSILPKLVCQTAAQSPAAQQSKANAFKQDIISTHMGPAGPPQMQ